MTKKRTSPELKVLKKGKPDYRRMYEAAIVRGDELQEQVKDLGIALKEAQDIAVFNMTMHVVAGLLSNPSFNDIDDDPDKMDATLDYGYKISERLISRFRDYMRAKHEAREKEEAAKEADDGAGKLN